MSDIFKHLYVLTSVKSEWIWNKTYQKLYKRARTLIKKDTYMEFHNEKEPLCLQTNTSEVSLGAFLLEVIKVITCLTGDAPVNTILWLTAFASKSLSISTTWYSNIEHEALGILHVLVKFHQYCFARGTSIITDHKLLITIFSKSFCKPISEITVHPTEYPSIQNKCNIQTRSWYTHSRLAVKTKPCWK